MATLIQQLELRIPPPVITLATALLMWAVSWGFHGLHSPFTQHKLLAVALAIAGAAISTIGVVSFMRARTTADPRRPETAP